MATLKESLLTGKKEKKIYILLFACTHFYFQKTSHFFSFRSNVQISALFSSCPINYIGMFLYHIFAKSPNGNNSFRVLNKTNILHSIIFHQNLRHTDIVSNVNKKH